MICHDCNKEMVESQEAYHYTECGLDNVYLTGIYVYRCECGESFPNIPSIIELNTVIGTSIINQHEPLTGKEVKFLRKNVGMTAKEFIGYIGVNKSTFSRWESGDQQLAKANDLLVRMVYGMLKNIPQKEMAGLLEQISKLNYKERGAKAVINVPIENLYAGNSFKCGVCHA